MYNQVSNMNRPYFQRRPPSQNRPNYPNRNTNFNNYQQSFNNSEQHWCETCDRGFNTPQQLEGHKQQHQKCNIDGCQFVAHPKVITKHIQMQHSSGIYKKIAKLADPEEVKKWIEERKKKYPTKENIDKKSAEIKEKIERGEKMGLRQDRFQRNNSKDAVKRSNNFNNGNNHTNQPTKRHRPNFETAKPHLKDKSKKDIRPKKVDTVAVIDESRKLRPFAGILNLDMDSDGGEEEEHLNSNFVIEDDDCETSNKIEEAITISEPTVCGALTSLMCDYGSSDEENDGINKDTTKIIEKENIIENKTKEIKVEIKPNTQVAEENKSDDDSGPEETKVVKNIDLPSTETTVINKVAMRPVMKKKDNRQEYKKRTYIRPKPKVPSTLLHKLLHREVRHERNVILQCVRYILKNNYFDK